MPTLKRTAEDASAPLHQANSTQLLLRWSGPAVFRQAKEWFQQGGVLEARQEGALVRGVVQIGGRKWRCGLKIEGADDIANLCACADARRGLVCAHSVAVALCLVESPPPTPQKSQEKTASHVPEPSATSASPAPIPPTAVPSAADPAALHITLEGSLREIQAQVQPPSDPLSPENTIPLTDFLSACQDAGWTIEKNRAFLRGEREILRFWAALLPEWEKRWTVAIGPRLRHVTRDVVRLRPQVSLADSGEGWLDFRLHYTAGDQAVLSADDLRRLLAGGQSSVALSDGRRAVVDADALEEWESVLRECETERTRTGWRVPGKFAGYLEESSRLLATHGIIKDQRKGEEKKTHTPWVPGPLFSQLRPYQQSGVQWLAAHHQARRGGLLADEMGLGKTVQALALAETLPGRSLVVCPASLVWNWAQEAARFCPRLPVVQLTGPQRHKSWEEAGDAGLFITSYGLLRRDVVRLAAVSWNAVILDEGQHIKNPESQNARTARQLQAQSRFVLSGTPLENALSDVWSIFHFLLPGYLGRRQEFQERYERPLAVAPSTSVATREHRRAWMRLHRRLSPYLLRRRKSELLPELPPKIEQVVEVTLGPRQRKAYDQLQAAARSQLEELQQGGKNAAGRMKVLTALLRLRQCCCDMRLLGTTAGEVSGAKEAAKEAQEEAEEGKLAALLEVLDEAVGGGSRVLVFSQFTTMLDLIEPALNRRGWAFSRLDGSTRHRAAEVARFQAPDGPPIFLISLKAGGVGLNLTAADTVIHYDPWWNPAVEAQATDRAHRLGQQRVVTSIKLIAAQTVEQRVLHLQERKRYLGSTTLDAETAWQSLGEEDIADLLAD